MPQPPMPTTEPLLDLIYSIRSIAQTLEIVHSEIRRIGTDNSREHEELLRRVQQLGNDVQMLPVSTTDRMDSFVTSKMDPILEDLRKSINDVRNKIWGYIQSRKEEARLTALTPAHGTPLLPIPSPSPPIVPVAHAPVSDEGIRFSWTTLKKVWGFGRWIVVLAAGGGLTAIIQAIVKALH